MKYWDIPDGTNCGEKTWQATKIATALGLAGSAYSIVLFPPKTVLEGIQRAGGTTLTMASLGAIFGITTCITAQVRDSPDDIINYFIGGCASGVFLGIKSRSYKTGFISCIGLGSLAASAKLSKNEGLQWFPSEPKL